MLKIQVLMNLIYGYGLKFQLGHGYLIFRYSGPALNLFGGVRGTEKLNKNLKLVFYFLSQALISMCQTYVTDVLDGCSFMLALKLEC